MEAQAEVMVFLFYVTGFLAIIVVMGLVANFLETITGDNDED